MMTIYHTTNQFLKLLLHGAKRFSDKGPETGAVASERSNHSSIVKIYNKPGWWFQPISKILVKKCQNWNLPQVGVKIKNI